MIEFTSQLQEQLEGQLLKIEQQTRSVLQQAELAIPVLQQKMFELRQFIESYEFKDEAEEILFFKEINPRLYYRLIYYVRLFHIETRLPSGCIEVQQSLLQSELKTINQFHSQNLHFHQYYKGNATHLDKQYFLRGKFDPKISPDELSILIDARFCTSHSYKIARIMAYERLQTYLNVSLRKLEQQEAIGQNTELQQLMPEWSASKSDLTELAYAFYCASILNNGKMGLYKIVSFVEALFNVELGDYRKLFRQMRMRKKNKTVFLDKLKDELLRYMDTSDERGWS